MGRVKPGEDGYWNMAANAATALAACVNMGSMAYAVYAVSQTVQLHGDQLAKPRPEHAAVAELTLRETAKVDMYNRIVTWQRSKDKPSLSSLWKACLVCASFFLFISNVMFVCLAELCFRPFAVSSDIEADHADDGLDGKIHTIVYIPWGLGGLIVFTVGVFLHLVFCKAMAVKTDRAMRAAVGTTQASHG